jgi:hypothetical protein
MTLSALGIFSAAGAAQGTYEHIETAIVSGTATTAITFSGLSAYSSSYRHLQIRTTARTSTAVVVNDDALRITFNASATGYAHHYLVAYNSGVTSSAGTNQTYGILMNPTGAGASTGVWGAGVVDILDPYSTSKNTTIRTMGGASSQTATDFVIGLFSSFWNNTAAVSSITITAPNAALLAGSRFSLYGIRG